MTATKNQILYRGLADLSLQPGINLLLLSLPLPPSPLHFNPRTAHTGSRCQEPRQPGLAHERVALCLFKLQHQFKQPRLCTATAPAGKAPGTRGHHSSRSVPSATQPCPPGRYCSCDGAAAGQGLSQRALHAPGTIHRLKKISFKKALRSHNPTFIPGQSDRSYFRSRGKKNKKPKNKPTKQPTRKKKKASPEVSG